MRLAVVALALAIIFYFAVRLLFGGRVTSWNQRLTVIVETPAGEVSGSSVTKVRKIDTSGPLVPPDASGVESQLTGEAVVLEVLPGKWLFVLLNGGDASWEWDATNWVYPGFGLEQAGSYERAMRRLKRQPRDTPVPLPPDAWPLMVTFEDINGPATVQRVDPGDLATGFGPGVAPKAVTLEVTRALGTEGKLESGAAMARSRRTYTTKSDGFA